MVPGVQGQLGTSCLSRARAVGELPWQEYGPGLKQGQVVFILQVTLILCPVPGSTGQQLDSTSPA